ncbi:hypothetical protein [Evansella clarkii]|uniref:hypothetical protein n=1 Tax=Evansella clarkii TaxID=79879 RepID=UPI000998CF3F|nr:hypothetical protein [Evansella clarkii]
MKLKLITAIVLLFITGCGSEELASYSFNEETENWQVSLFVEEKPYGENVTEEAELTFEYVGEEPVPGEVEVIVDTAFQYRGKVSQQFEEFEGKENMPFGNSYFIEANRTGSPYTVEIIWNDQVEEFILELEEE